MASILGANAAVSDGPRFSYWAAEPREVFEIALGGAGPLERIETAMAKYQITGKPSGLPDGLFFGGWIGYLSYELGRHIERLPQRAVDDLSLPLIRLCFYDRFLAYDHREDAFWIIALELPDDDETPERKIETVERILDEATCLATGQLPAAEIEHLDMSHVRSNIGEGRYLRAVEQSSGHPGRRGLSGQPLPSLRAVLTQSSPSSCFHWKTNTIPAVHALSMRAASRSSVRRPSCSSMSGTAGSKQSQSRAPGRVWPAAIRIVWQSIAATSMNC
jgi:hypothetical protein